MGGLCVGGDMVNLFFSDPAVFASDPIIYVTFFLKIVFRKRYDNDYEKALSKKNTYFGL